MIRAGLWLELEKAWAAGEAPPRAMAPTTQVRARPGRAWETAIIAAVSAHTADGPIAPALAGLVGGIVELAGAVVDAPVVAEAVDAPRWSAQWWTLGAPSGRAEVMMGRLSTGGS